MTREQAKQLAPGLYRLHWKSGGWSLASVGITHDGTRWFAPTNWTSQVPDVRCSEWRAVEHVDVIDVVDPSSDSSADGIAARVAALEARVAQLEAHPAGCSCTRCTG